MEKTEPSVSKLRRVCDFVCFWKAPEALSRLEERRAFFQYVDQTVRQAVQTYTPAHQRSPERINALEEHLIRAQRYGVRVKDRDFRLLCQQPVEKIYALTRNMKKASGENTSCPECPARQANGYCMCPKFLSFLSDASPFRKAC
jgi:hypothetical protein